MNLTQKVIVITGGAKGLGKALANVLKEKKADVVTLDKNEPADFLVDMTDESQVSDVAQKIVDKFGHIDVWINNAGIWMPRQLLEEIDMQKAKRLFEVNVFGTIHGSRAALRHMKLLQHGIIVNIISTTALDGMNGSSGSMYVASKYALRGLTNELREETKSSGVRVLGVYPSGIKTDIFNEAKPSKFDQFMPAELVAAKIVENLERDEPDPELVIKNR